MPAWCGAEWPAGSGGASEPLGSTDVVVEAARVVLEVGADPDGGGDAVLGQHAPDEGGRRAGGNEPAEQAGELLQPAGAEHVRVTRGGGEAAQVGPLGQH